MTLCDSLRLRSSPFDPLQLIIYSLVSLHCPGGIQDSSSSVNLLKESWEPLHLRVRPSRPASGRSIPASKSSHNHTMQCISS